MDPSTTAPLTCEGGEEGDDVGVWQFVHGTTNESGVIYGFALCQYGDRADKPPVVPYTVCKNADCTDFYRNWGDPIDP